MGSKKRNKSKVLNDHKKVGKTFIPPLREYMGDNFAVSWTDRILPELIWLALIIESFGIKRGVTIGASVAKSANSLLPKEYFAFVSLFDLMNDEQKQELIQLLEKENCLEELRKSLNPFLRLYPKCPLKFLDDGSDQSFEAQDVIDFKQTLAKYFNRHKQPAMIIQANVIYFAAICGKLHYTTDVQVPNIEAIVSDFDSEESKGACARVRATLNGFMGHFSDSISDDWPRYFWNRGIEIDPPVPIQSFVAELEIKLPEKIRRFIELADLGLSERWRMLPKDVYENQQCEVIGALLARQVTLAKRMARNPDMCDVHIGPILLRVMIDNHITLSWILKDPNERSKLFVLYGLGQDKLFLEYLKADAKDGNDPDMQQFIEIKERWINSQQYSFLTNVNLGSWSGLSSRDMAEEADCLDLYRYAYTPFSSCVHNMWNHVGRLNVDQSGNPLHKYLLVPCDPEMKPEVDLLLDAAKYLQKSFCAVDDAFGLKFNTVLPYDYWFTKNDEVPSAEEA